MLGRSACLAQHKRAFRRKNLAILVDQEDWLELLLGVILEPSDVLVQPFPIGMRRLDGERETLGPILVDIDAEEADLALPLRLPGDLYDTLQDFRILEDLDDVAFI